MNSRKGVGPGWCRLWIVGAVFGSLTGCGGGSSSGTAAEPTSPATSEQTSEAPQVFTVSGEIRVPLDLAYAGKQKDDPVIGQTKCRAAASYDDVVTGAPVIVRNGSGDTLAIGTLLDGLLGGDGGRPVMLTPCAFDFEIPDVPQGESFYSIEVAHRGEVSYKPSALVDHVVIKLGH